jgi:hypothetical protein
MRSTGTFTASAKAARMNSDGAQISWKRERLLEKRGGTADAHERRHCAGALLEPDMLV